MPSTKLFDLNGRVAVVTGGIGPGSIVIFFVLLIPTFIAHDEKVSKLTFFARLLTQFAI
jgi:hypothetical protein